MRQESSTTLLQLQGSPRERGRAHGEAIRPLIQQGVQRWLDGLPRSLGMAPAEYVDHLVERTGLLAAVQQWAPHLLEEVAGIGEGAGIDFRTIFAYQCADEDWWYRRSLRAGRAERCSAVGCFATGDSPTVVAQNLDLPAHFDGSQVLLHIQYPDSDLEVLTFTAAGIIAGLGMNNRSLGVCVNTLSNLNHSPDGLPVDFVVRLILEQPSLAAATRAVEGLPHASGQNYMIGDSQIVVDFECSAGAVAQYIPYPGARCVYHTNHELANINLAPEAERVVLANTTTEARFQALTRLVAELPAPVTPQDVMAILRSHEGPICRHPGQPGGFTYGSIVMALATDPEMYVTAGPPCELEYEVFSFA